MSDKAENKKSDRIYKIYLPHDNLWVEVTEEVYLEYYRPVWRIQKAAQKAGRCTCPKTRLWACDGDCLTCMYGACGNTVSLDAPIKDGIGIEFCLTDLLADPNSDFSDALIDRLLLEKLLDDLAKHDPEGKQICELVMAGCSKAEIAESMQCEFGGNWYKSKAAYREKRVMDYLRERLKEL